MQVPVISVVVPLYNKAPYIERCLDSILRQTFTDFEVIVIDDGSTDGSGTVAARQSDSRVRVVTQVNRGAGAARNRGIQEARAGLIAFLDADDTWESRFLETVVKLSKNFPEAGWLATGYRRCMGAGWDREVTIRRNGNGHMGSLVNYLVLAREGDLVTSSSVALRRSAVDKIGGFIEGEPIGEDQDLWIRLAARYPLGFDSDILAAYHSESGGRTSNVEAKPAVLPAVRSLGKLLNTEALPEKVRTDAISYIDWTVFKHAAGMLYDGDRSTIETVLRTTQFAGLRFRIQAALLQMGLKLLPMRVIAAMRLKPASLLWTLRRTPGVRHVVFFLDALRGRTIVQRPVPGSKD